MHIKTKACEVEMKPSGLYGKLEVGRLSVERFCDLTGNGLSASSWAWRQKVDQAE